MQHDIYDEWLAWSRAYPEPETVPACDCERRDEEVRVALSRLTPQMVEAAAQAIFGQKN